MKNIINLFNNKISVEDCIIDILMTFSGFKNSDFTAGSIDTYRNNLKHKLNHARLKGYDLEIVLPGFPYKSANHKDKTLSHLPDLGEDIALRRLEKLRKNIAKASGLPTKLIIASDGFAFNDLKGIPDKNVVAYGMRLRKLAKKHSNPIEMTNINDLLFRRHYRIDDDRAYLMEHYGRSVTNIYDEMAHNDNLAMLYEHLCIFAKHDLVRKTGETKKAFKSRSKDVALHVMSRSEAWAELVEHHYPNAIRLSIHPYKDASKKFPVRLLDSVDGRWRTPWHNAPIVTGTPPFGVSVKLAPLKWAKANGAVMGDDPHLPCMIDKDVDLYNHVMTCHFGM